jgi:hypothetical protein
MTHQTFHQWQQNPIQGAIPTPSPFTRADEQYLAEVLTECRTKLESALSTAQGYTRLPDLAAGIGDALTGCQEALTVLNDPATYLE